MSEWLVKYISGSTGRGYYKEIVEADTAEGAMQKACETAGPWAMEGGTFAVSPPPTRLYHVEYAADSFGLTEPVIELKGSV